MLRQLVELIPPHLAPKLARETGADRQARTFSSWSHVVTMLYAQVSHAPGLNDGCDALRLQVSALWAVRGATPPARNTPSHANKTRAGALNSSSSPATTPGGTIRAFCVGSPPWSRSTARTAKWFS